MRIDWIKNCILVLSLMIIVELLMDLTIGVCVNNQSCRAAHAEVYDRSGGLFVRSFSKRINANSKECCDSKNPDCRYGTADDALFWVDCDTDKKKESSGQVVVACSKCEINISDDGIITVTEEDEPKRTRAVYLCKDM